MRNLIYLFVILIFNLSCEPKINNYYAGFVIDEFGNPVQDVLVKEISDSRKTRTDKTGFFKLNKDKNITCNLSIEKDGYIRDSISTFDFITDPDNWEDGETIYSSILKSDTTKIILKKQPNDLKIKR